MTLESLNYYGYNRNTYKMCLELIGETDLHHAKMLNTWFTVLCLAFFIVSQRGRLTVLSGNPLVYLCFFAAALLWEIAVFFKGKPAGWSIRLAVFVTVVFLFAFSIYLSVAQPYMSSAMFPVIMVVVAFSYIDTFFSIASIILLGSIVFGITSYIYKPLAIVYVDIFNAVIFLSLSLILHYIFQRMRISRFVVFYENRDFQRNLEVKSSFDALTSLLNRGRFFSMAGEIVKNPHEDSMYLCLFDLDGFKQINDKLGHQMGDKAIQLTGENLLKGFEIDFGEKWSFEKRAVSEKLSFAGRLGGDEFIVFLRGRKDREEIRKEAEQVLENLANVKAGELNGIHSSVGIVELGLEDRDIDVAYSRADAALYQSKAAGKHTITFSEQ